MWSQLLTSRIQQQLYDIWSNTEDSIRSRFRRHHKIITMIE